MFDCRVKAYLKQRGSSPDVYFGGLPRLVWRWNTLCEKISNGKVPTYDGYRGSIGVRTQIHNCVHHALPCSVERFRDVIFAADQTFLASSTCYEDLIRQYSGSEPLQDHWWLYCQPSDIPVNEASDWPTPKKTMSVSAVRYEPGDRVGNVEDHQPQYASAIVAKARFLVQSGELQRHCVGELKRAGLNADIDQDGEIDSQDELEILEDIVADIIANSGEGNCRRSSDGRECYLYRHKKLMLILICDPSQGGTAFIPVLGERFFESWV